MLLGSQRRTENAMPSMTRMQRQTQSVEEAGVEGKGKDGNVVIKHLHTSTWRCFDEEQKAQVWRLHYEQS